MERDILGLEYRNGNGTVLTALYTGYWPSEPEHKRVWFEYPDGDVGSKRIVDLARELEYGDWSKVLR